MLRRESFDIKDVAGNAGFQIHCKKDDWSHVAAEDPSRLPGGR